MAKREKRSREDGEELPEKKKLKTKKSKSKEPSTEGRDEDGAEVSEKKKLKSKKNKSKSKSSDSKESSVEERHEDGAEEPEKKKSKTKKSKSKSSESKESSTEGQHAAPAKQDSAYTQSDALNAIPQAEIEKFLEENSIKITDSGAESSSLRPILSFSHLPSCENGLYDPLRSFASPTPIQSVTWPLLFAGRDVIGIAETGSGKTLAFGLPCLKKISDSGSSKKRKSAQPTALMISPTRELATQIRDQITKYAEPANAKVSCIFGGVKKEEQREMLKTADIVVATPGRLKDLMNDGSVDLGKVEYLVLDEADRMLDKGFEQDIKDILQSTPASSRQTVMFTATWPQAVRELASTFTSSPVTVTVGGDPSADPRANTRIKQVVEVVKPQEKEARLVQLLNQSQRVPDPAKVLVFCLYKKEATRIENFLRGKRFRVAGIHGDLGQQERFKSLEAFKSGDVAVLVATDVAARGLDIPSVKTVLNFTFPLTVEDYVHRIGR